MRKVSAERMIEGQTGSFPGSHTRTHGGRTVVEGHHAEGRVVGILSGPDLDSLDQVGQPLNDCRPLAGQSEGFRRVSREMGEKRLGVRRLGCRNNNGRTEVKRVSVSV